MCNEITNSRVLEPFLNQFITVIKGVRTYSRTSKDVFELNSSQVSRVFAPKYGSNNRP